MVSQFEVIRDRLFADVQQSLDNAVENYFAELAKTDVIALTDISGQKAFLRDDSIPERSITRISIDQKNSSNGLLDQLTGNEKLFQTLEKAGTEDFSSAFWEEIQSDSTHEMVILDSNRRMAIDKKNDLQIFFGKDQADSIDQLKIFTSKIIISITRDSLDFDKLNALFYRVCFT